MDDIVERFLVNKLDEDIKKARKAAELEGLESKCNKFISVLNECKDLLKLINEKKEKTGASVKDTRREKLYYLLNLIVEWHELWKKKLQPKALISVDEISRKLKQVKKVLEDEPQSTPTEESPSKDPQVYRWSCHAMNLAKTHGFEDKRMIMERLLLKQPSKAIGIVGVAGVGKTALCQQAYNNQPVKEHFLLRIWLCLSKNPKTADPLSSEDQHKMMLSCLSFEDQLKMMLSCLGFEDQVIQKIGDQKLRLALQRHLNRGRYLIVLDDVWTVKENGKVVVENEVQKLFRFLTRPHSSPYQGTLILTSRWPELEQTVGANNMHRLLPLADESCWNIFTDAFEEDGSQLNQDAKLKRNILEKCAGLPLMAKMLGKIGASLTRNP